VAGWGASDERAERISLTLTRYEAELLVDALETHEYWECGTAYGLPRRNGVVYLPEDGHGFWTDVDPGPQQQAGIDQARSCRALATRLWALLQEESGA
jgi:hypothetical protein